MDAPVDPQDTPNKNADAFPHKLPDPAICRTLYMGVAKLYACLVERPINCPHLVPYGGKNFCAHWDPAMFVRTPPKE